MGILNFKLSYKDECYLMRALKEISNNVCGNNYDAYKLLQIALHDKRKARDIFIAHMDGMDIKFKLTEIENSELFKVAYDYIMCNMSGALKYGYRSKEAKNVDKAYRVPVVFYKKLTFRDFEPIEIKYTLDMNKVAIDYIDARSKIYPFTKGKYKFIEVVQEMYKSKSTLLVKEKYDRLKAKSIFGLCDTFEMLVYTLFESPDLPSALFNKYKFINKATIAELRVSCTPRNDLKRYVTRHIEDMYYKSGMTNYQFILTDILEESLTYSDMKESDRINIITDIMASNEIINLAEKYKIIIYVDRQDAILDLHSSYGRIDLTRKKIVKLTRAISNGFGFSTIDSLDIAMELSSMS